MTTGPEYTEQSGGWVPFVRTSSYQIAHLIDPSGNVTLCGRYRGRVHMRMDEGRVSRRLQHCKNCMLEKQRRVGK